MWLQHSIFLHPVAEEGGRREVWDETVPMKMYRTVTPCNLNLGIRWSATHPSSLIPKKEPGTYLTRGLVDPRDGLDRW